MQVTNKVYLSLGSNLDKQKNIKSCLNYLSSSFNNILISPIYQSPSFGFEGNDFYNLVVKIETCFELKALKLWLMKLEDLHGRDRSKPRYSNRTLDIDILLFNTLVVDDSFIVIPRPEILTQAYVLKPLTDIASQLNHPQTYKSFSQHWNEIKHLKNNRIKQIKLN
jgi:2-amino-4-hydroxy-6-hydroxymethyldihydropteridine diphosphokinase